MKKQFGDYYFGIDAGTDSVGWAVTDEAYTLQKINGKAMWGIRLFDAGESAKRDVCSELPEEGRAEEFKEQSCYKNYLRMKSVKLIQNFLSE